MCGVVRHHLGKGRCAPVASPAMAPDRHRAGSWPVERLAVPSPASERPCSPAPHGQPCAVWMPPAPCRWTTRREMSALPAPIAIGAYRRPYEPTRRAWSYPLHRHRTMGERQAVRSPDGFKGTRSDSRVSQRPSNCTRAYRVPFTPSFGSKVISPTVKTRTGRSFSRICCR